MDIRARDLPRSKDLCAACAAMANRYKSPHQRICWVYAGKPYCRLHLFHRVRLSGDRYLSLLDLAARPKTDTRLRDILWDIESMQAQWLQARNAERTARQTEAAISARDLALMKD